METDAAIALAPPWERANAKIVEDYQERNQKIQAMLNIGELSSDQAARRMAASWTQAFAQMRDELANKMETLFDDITSGNIGQAFLKMFKALVFQMLATWILGMQGMHAAASQTMTGSGGGMLGSILGSLGMGGISGGGSGGGSQSNISNLPGVITNMGGGSSGESSSDNPFGLIPGMTISAGAGSGSLGTVLPAGAFGSSGGGIMGLLQNGQIQQLMAVGGTALFINGLGKAGLGGALERIGGGALSGAGIGSMILPGIGTVIGAAIGALVGLFAGLFGQHTGDKARINVMEPLVAQIKVITDSYDVFQTDYNSGVTGLETLRTDSIAALKKIGGRQVSGNTKGVDADVDAAELHLKTTEAERNRRAQIDFGPPQFLAGGYVDAGLAGGAPAGFAASALHFASGGAVPAILHAGEYVMRPSAVQRMGVDTLSAMNSGGSGGGFTNINITTMDSKSFSGWLRDGGLRVIMREMARGNSEGGF
jgi:hypothetical protein